MQCEYQKRTFDTDTMAAFPTGVECMPMIYVNADRLCFLEINRRRWEEPQVKYLHRREALRYADLYKVAGLREILTLATVVEKVGGIVEGLTSFMKELNNGHGESGTEGQTLEVKRMMQSFEAICRTENAKVLTARWLHPFIQKSRILPESQKSQESLWLMGSVRGTITRC
jgi:hypothetical protein